MKTKTFGGWPTKADKLNVREIAKNIKDGIDLRVLEFTSQGPFRLRAYVAQPAGMKLRGLHLEVIKASQWPQQLGIARAGFAPAFREEFTLAGIKTEGPLPQQLQRGFQKWVQYMKQNRSAYATFTVRGIGNTALKDDERHRTQVRRRFMLLGQTLAGMQVYDILRSVDALRTDKQYRNLPLHMWGNGEMANNVLLASLFSKNVTQLHLSDLATDDKLAPDYLNISRIVTWPDLIKLAQERTKFELPKPKRNGGKR